MMVTCDRRPTFSHFPEQNLNCTVDLSPQVRPVSTVHSQLGIHNVNPRWPWRRCWCRCFFVPWIMVETWKLVVGFDAFLALNATRRHTHESLIRARLLPHASRTCYLPY